MTDKDMKDIVEQQVKLIIQEKDMKRSDLNDLEYLQWCYDVAIRMLINL